MLTQPAVLECGWVAPLFCLLKMRVQRIRSRSQNSKALQNSISYWEMYWQVWIWKLHSEIGEWERKMQISIPYLVKCSFGLKFIKMCPYFEACRSLIILWQWHSIYDLHIPLFSECQVKARTWELDVGEVWGADVTVLQHPLLLSEGLEFILE